MAKPTGLVSMLRSTGGPVRFTRSEEHTSELQSPCNFVCRLLLANKKWYVQSIGMISRSHYPQRHKVLISRSLPTLVLHGFEPEKPVNYVDPISDNRPRDKLHLDP